MVAAPTGLIHRNYDSGFCGASELTMRLNGDSWEDILLARDEVRRSAALISGNLST